MSEKRRVANPIRYKQNRKENHYLLLRIPHTTMQELRDIAAKDNQSLNAQILTFVEWGLETALPEN